MQRTANASTRNGRVGSTPTPSAMVDVAQLVRVSACDAECRGFKSRHSPHGDVVQRQRQRT